jgi:hypothetical protein
MTVYTRTKDTFKRKLVFFLCFLERFVKYLIITFNFEQIGSRIKEYL